MDEDLLLDLLKEALDIRHTKRDKYLSNKIKGVVKELEDEKGIALEPDNMNHIMFVVDYAEHRVKNPKEEMSRDLKFRLNNLMIHNGGKSNENGGN